MVRSVKVPSEFLDSQLVELQEMGGSISQVIPCPGSIDFEQPKDGDDGTFGGGVKMNFMIIYIEKKEEG